MSGDAKVESVERRRPVGFVDWDAFVGFRVWEGAGVNANRDVR